MFLKVTEKMQRENKYTFNCVGMWAYVEKGRAIAVDKSIGFLMGIAAMFAGSVEGATPDQLTDSYIDLKKELCALDDKITAQFPKALGPDSLDELLALNELYEQRAKLEKLIMDLNVAIDESLARGAYV
jgi:hypothetical protein